MVAAELLNRWIGARAAPQLKQVNCDYQLGAQPAPQLRRDLHIRN
jgi:hypothetical protein